MTSPREQLERLQAEHALRMPVDDSERQEMNLALGALVQQIIAEDARHLSAEIAGYKSLLAAKIQEGTSILSMFAGTSVGVALELELNSPVPDFGLDEGIRERFLEYIKAIGLDPLNARRPSTPLH